MKTWHWIALGVGAFAVARAVNTYRGTHYTTNPDGSSGHLTWGQGLKGVLGLGNFPSPVHVPTGMAIDVLTGAIVPAPLTLPTPQPAAGVSGLGPNAGGPLGFTNGVK